MKEPEGVNSLQEESGSRFPGASCVKLRLDQERRRWVGASALCRVHTSSCAPGPTETLHSPQGLHLTSCIWDSISHNVSPRVPTSGTQVGGNTTNIWGSLLPTSRGQDSLNWT